MMALKLPETEEVARDIPAIDSSDALIIKQEIERIGAKKILEFGPGDTTQIILDLGVESIVTCEYIDKWLDVAKERFKDEPRVTVTRFYDEFPVTVDGVAEDEQFDMAFVDSPKGFNPVRKVHPGFGDTSRLNTLIYALNRAPVVLLHDADRPLERGSLGRLWATGKVNIEFIVGRNITTARITKREQRQDGPNPQDATELGGSPPGPEPECGGEPVNRRPDRSDAGGTQDEASVSN